MDHDEAREIMELAAAEPGGAGRLEAGDTPEAIAVASHLADCASCRAEWVRLTALGEMLRDAMSEHDLADDPSQVHAERRLPVAAGAEFSAPPELRDRTLRFVRELGVPRGAAAETAGVAAAASPAATSREEPSIVSIAPLGAPVVPLRGFRGRTSGRWRLAGQLAGLAAVVALVVGLGAFALIRDQQARQAEEAKASLQAVNSAMLALAGEQADLASAKDAVKVDLASGDGSAKGWILYSAQRDQMIMVATGLPSPSGGAVVRCWVESAAGRRVVGDVVFEGGLAYWSGWPQGGLADVQAGAKFGVSFMQPGQPQGTGTVLMTGIVGG